jgi:hypothetical protein
MSDWYLARQLKNFRSGIRGAHEQDFYGAQMAAMARVLIDERAPDDIVAYINTFKPVDELTAANLRARVAPQTTPGSDR